MGILSGSASVRQYYVLGPRPTESELDEKLNEHRFRPFEGGQDEERSGFRNWRNPILEEPEAGVNLLGDGWVMLAILIETRKVPGKLLKAHVAKRIKTLMTEGGAAFVGKEQRALIKEEVKAELLPKMPPTQKVVEAAWNLRKGVLFAGSPGAKGESALRALLLRGFNCEIQQTLPLHRAAQAGIALERLEESVALVLGGE